MTQLIRAVIDSHALHHNLSVIRSHANGARVIAVVKANAYGHGLASTALALGEADALAVARLEGALALRAAGIGARIVLLEGVFSPAELDEAVYERLDLVVHDASQIELLERFPEAARLPLWLKIDTGMNRLGIATSDVECFARQLAKCKHLRLGGVMTHFASSEAFAPAPQGQQTPDQENNFHAALERLRKLGIDTGIVHMANSAAIAARPESWGDMVRPGVILYGYHPGYDPADQRAEAERRLPLKPVMSLRTRIISLRRVPAGTGVGYGAKFVAPRPSVIAVLAAGYGDGIHRSLSNRRGCVLVRGKLAPIVGIVSMDVTMIDVTEVDGVAVGEVVTIYGTDGEHLHPANAVARAIGTVTSDLLCAVTARVPRVYVV